MEVVEGTNIIASKFEAQDFISNMPDIVVTNIMDRLPIHDAVRTSILSRDWRLKWTMLSQLVFDMHFFKNAYALEDEIKFGMIISRLLLQTKGAITKFVLCLGSSSYPINLEEIILEILFWCRKGIKDLTLERFDAPLKLPTYLFSCLKLKHLKLEYCCFDPPTSFHCFPNLLSLELDVVDFESGKIGEQCPVLEILKIGSPYVYNKLVKVADFANLANLKILSLLLLNLDNPRSATIFELVDYLPKLQELHLDFACFKPKEIGAKKMFISTFPCLKTLKVSCIDPYNGIMLSYVFEMIKSFSDLHTLEISAYGWVSVSTPGPKIDYNTMGLLQLQSVVYTNFKALDVEVCLITCLLACSPKLKKIVINTVLYPDRDEQLRFSRMLLKLQRAYPAVDINLR